MKPTPPGICEDCGRELSSPAFTRCAKCSENRQNAEAQHFAEVKANSKRRRIAWTPRRAKADARLIAVMKKAGWIAADTTPYHASAGREGDQ